MIVRKVKSCSFGLEGVVWKSEDGFTWVKFYSHGLGQWLPDEDLIELGEVEIPDGTDLLSPGEIPASRYRLVPLMMGGKQVGKIEVMTTEKGDVVVGATTIADNVPVTPFSPVPNPLRPGVIESFAIRDCGITDFMMSEDPNG